MHMEGPQNFDSECDRIFSLLESRADAHLQQGVQLLDSQNEVLLDEQVQAQMRELEEDQVPDEGLAEAPWAGEEEDEDEEDEEEAEAEGGDGAEGPCQLRQLQLQVELQSQQAQVEELDATFEAVIAASEDFSKHAWAPRGGGGVGGLRYRAGRRVQAQLPRLAEQVRRLLPHVAEEGLLLPHGPGRRVWRRRQRLCDVARRLGAAIQELSESLCQLQAQRMDSSEEQVQEEFRRVEALLAEQDLKLRALRSRIDGTVAELDAEGAAVPRAPKGTPFASTAQDAILDILLRTM